MDESEHPPTLLRSGRQRGDLAQPGDVVLPYPSSVVAHPRRTSVNLIESIHDSGE